MARVKVKVKLGNYKALRARIDNPSAALRPVEIAIRERVGVEFAAGSGWKPRKPFGDKPGGLAFEGSRLRRAWSTPGAPGAVARATAKGMEIGVSRAMFLWDKAHQRGAVIKARKFVDTPGGKRAAMGMALYSRFGVRLREETMRKGLVLPARPHARKTPALIREVKQALLQYFKGK